MPHQSNHDLSSLSDSSSGGTELLPALRHILTIEQRFSSQRRSHIVLITDGQVPTRKLF
jgi:Mg-chelatase subunit ChlD